MSRDGCREEAAILVFFSAKACQFSSGCFKDFWREYLSISRLFQSCLLGEVVYPVLEKEGVEVHFFGCQRDTFF